MSSPIRRAGRILLLATLAFGVVGGGTTGYRWYAARQHLRAAHVALEAYRYDTAYAEISRCFPFYSDRPEVVLQAARMARRAGKVDEAQRHLEALAVVQENLAAGASSGLETVSLSEEIRLEHQLLAAQQGTASDFAARALWERMRIDRSHRVLILEALYLGLFERSQFDGALQMIQEWLKEPTADPRAHYWHGVLLNKKYPLGAEAIAAFEQALSLDANYADARFALAMLYLDAGNVAAAEPLLWHLEQSRPEPAIAIGLARCQALRGEYAQAERQLRDVVSGHPDEPLALRELAGVLLHTGAFDESLTISLRVAQLWPHDLTTSYNILRAHQRLHQDTLAEQQHARHKQLEERQKKVQRLLLTELQKQPNHIDHMHELGKVMLQIGGVDYETQGLHWLQRVLQRDPRHKPTYALLADYYEKSHNLEMAQRCRRLAK